MSELWRYSRDAELGARRRGWRCRRPLRGALRRAARAMCWCSRRGRFWPRPACSHRAGSPQPMGDDDDPSLHAEDTLRTGRGLCRPSAVSVLTDEAPGAYPRSRRARRRVRRRPRPRRRVTAGRRVVHAGGAATGDRGRAKARRTRARASAHSSRRGRADALDLARRRALRRGRHRPPCGRGARDACSTGGAAALWERTTNPAGAVGEGMAAAYRAGAALADLEFVQFHPTTLVDSSLLLSEALRGEGALLLDEQGNRFTGRARAARRRRPRDRRARNRAARPARDRPRPLPVARWAACVEEGYDPAETPIPVAPAAHYTVGGVAHRSRRPERARRPVRGGRVRRDRRPRREPARVELARSSASSSDAGLRWPRSREPAAPEPASRRSRKLQPARACHAGAPLGALARLRPHPRCRRAPSTSSTCRTCSRA